MKDQLELVVGDQRSKINRKRWLEIKDQFAGRLPTPGARRRNDHNRSERRRRRSGTGAAQRYGSLLRDYGRITVVNDMITVVVSMVEIACLLL